MTQKPLIFLHLKLVAKVGLSLAVLSVLTICAVLLVLGGTTGDSYEALVRSSSQIRQHLNAAMLLGGLALVAVTGLVTWLIVLYSSFRIAGPLFRLSQNLKLANESDTLKLIDLRHGDALNRQADDIKQAVSALRQHRLEITQCVDEALLAHKAGHAAHYAQAIARLTVLDEKVHL